MKRRTFIAVLGSAAAWPVVARAQPSSVPRVGYVWIGARGTDDLNQAGLRQGFVDKGYVIGRDLALEERYADSNIEQVPVLIAELLALNVDVLVTPGLLVSRAAKRATSRVPIVCAPVIRSALVWRQACPDQGATSLACRSSRSTTAQNGWNS